MAEVMQVAEVVQEIVMGVSDSMRIYLIIAITIVATAGLIYLTPLKHLNIVEPTINDISAEEFHSLYTQNPDDYLFIDVRSAQAYNTLHAEGSINIPLHEFYNQRKIFPKKGKEIVLICSGGVASGVAYSYLEHYGFFNIRRIQDGIESWQAADLPVVRQANE